LAKSSKTDAEVRYANAQKRIQDVAKARTEVQSEAKRVSDNTARLKGLRLAKEAADLAAKLAAPPVKKGKARAKAAPAGKVGAEKGE
jgi:hypothetical protein